MSYPLNMRELIVMRIANGYHEAKVTQHTPEDERRTSELWGRIVEILAPATPNDRDVVAKTFARAVLTPDELDRFVALLYGVAGRGYEAAKLALTDPVLVDDLYCPRCRHRYDHPAGESCPHPIHHGGGS